MTLAEKLNRLTKCHNLSRLAEASAISKYAIFKALKGKSRPRPATIVMLAQALNVDADWMADDSRDWPPVWAHREGRVAAVS